MTIVAVTGFNAEAKIAARAGVTAIACGGNSALLQEKLRRLAKLEAVISIGIAGGLAPGLKSGTCIIATEIVHGGERFATDSSWRERMSAKFAAAVQAPIAGSDAIVATREAKAELHRATGAVAADMESHIAAVFAASRKLPFVALRIIADPAESALPPLVFKALDGNGRIRYGAVLGSIARRPAQIPALLRTGRETNIALRELLRCVETLGARFAAPDVGKLLLDMG